MNSLLRRFCFLAVLIAAVNAVSIAVLGSYDFRLGPVHLAAHGLFKPLLYLSAAILVAALANCEPNRIAAGFEWSPNAWLIAAAAVLLYLPSLGIFFQHNDWTHQADARNWTSLGDLARLFVWKQPDGFYRPLAFLSLWVDYRIFGDHEWGYHLQNLLLHAANCLLLVRVALRLGFDTVTARWTGLLFAVAAANYEPVIWPGARFDLMAACFTLAALLFAIEWWHSGRRSSLWGLGLCYLAAVFSKERGYCLPLLLAWIALTPRQWKVREASFVRRAIPVVGVGVLSVALLALRASIFHGMGGYPDASGTAPHFAIHLSTFTSFFTRALPVPVFAVNTIMPGALAVFAIVLCAIAACGYAAFCGGAVRLKFAILLAALLSAVPAVNLVDWIGPELHNSRYVYMPALWISLLLSFAATAKARKWLLLLAVANALAAIHNYRAFDYFGIGKPSPL